MEILTGIMIAGFIFYSGNLIGAGELTVNSFSHSCDDDACIPTCALTSNY